NSHEVGTHRFALLVGQLLRGLRLLFTRVDERVDAARSVARSRRDAGIEIDVDADRAALFGTEARQLAKPVPIHGYSHLRLLLPESGDSKAVARDAAGRREGRSGFAGAPVLLPVRIFTIGHGTRPAEELV